MKHDHCQLGPLHKRLSLLLSCRHSSLLQECEEMSIWTLNMPSLPFMSMEPDIKKGDSSTQEEKVLSMGKKFWNY
jgi:hypothetical protein